MPKDKISFEFWAKRIEVTKLHLEKVAIKTVCMSIASYKFISS